MNGKAKESPAIYIIPMLFTCIYFQNFTWGCTRSYNCYNIHN